MSEKKPIFDIKDDIQKVIVSVDKLHKDVNDLRKLNKEMIDIIANRLANKDNIVISSEPIDFNEDNWTCIPKNTIGYYEKNVLKFEKI